MPTYEYECEACGHRFEKFQSITAKPVRTCPDCGKPRCKRLLGTGSALIFRGSGFYATDYRSKSYREAAKKDKGGAKAAESGTGKSSKEAGSSGSAGAGGKDGKAS
jgi:putative FmdB family regulatory protein